jgi:hypothetical protein
MRAALDLRLRQHCHFLTLAFSLLKETIFENKLTKTKRPPSMPNHKFSENVYLEKLLSVVQ